MKAALFTEAKSAKMFSNQSDMAVSASGAARIAEENDAINAKLAMSAQEIMRLKIENIASAAENKERQDAARFSHASFKLTTAATPEKAATANSSSLFGGKIATNDVNAPTSTTGFTK